MKVLFTITFLISFITPIHAQSIKENVIDCNPTINVFGTKKGISAKNFVESIRLNTINLSSTTIGYGPSTGYKNEITIIDGQFHIATATSKTTLKLSNTISDDIGAVFLVTSSPDKWTQTNVEEHINGTNGIIDLIAQQVKSNGCNPLVSIPFKITANTDQVEWSIVGRPKGASSTESNQAITIVGIYSSFKNKHYFLPKNLEIHAHVTISNKGITGHLRSIGELKDIVIYLPAKK